MPATLVLSGVRSPRTKASSVTSSARPPSQAFQFRVSVTITATARSRTITGVADLSHGQRALGGAAACSCGTAGVACGGLDGAGLAAEAALMFGLLGLRHSVSRRYSSIGNLPKSWIQQHARVGRWGYFQAGGTASAEIGGLP